MKPDIKKLWVDALRSGDYKQGLSALEYVEVRDNHEHVVHCCLGVLCDVYTKQTGKDWHFDKTCEFLPEPVMRWAGLENMDPVLPSLDDEHSDRVSCSDANDAPVSFDKIADAIEVDL